MRGGKGRTLVLASGNRGKLQEIDALLAPEGFDLRPQSDWETPEAEETGQSFLENAILKARNACAHTGHVALADDSGLVVPALKGAPGIRSARYAGAGASDAANNALLLETMQDLHGADRRAYFYCAMILARTAEDPAPLVATAAWHGSILEAPRGRGGFGYDPIFLVAGKQQSSAELPAAEKNRISHRGQALQAMSGQIYRLDDDPN